MASRKAALVTGGATGIGRSAVLALARAGYDVAINYSSSETAARETAAEARSPAPRTLLLRCDVSDEAGVRAMLRAVGENVRPGSTRWSTTPAPPRRGSRSDLESLSTRGMGPRVRGQRARHCSR